MLKLFVVLIVSLVCLELTHTVKGQTGLSKEELEAISSFAEVGISASKAAAHHNVEAVVEVIVNLGKAIPSLGPISTILSGILSIFGKHPDELAAVKRKLNEMDSHLFAIENKIDNIAKEIKDVAETNYYREHAEKINILQDAYQRYVNTPTPITHQSLVKQCQNNEQLVYINYVHRELTEGAQPLLKLIKGDYDLKKFESWSRLLVSSISQAMYLHSVCIGLQYPASAERHKTITGDIQHFHTISGSLEKVTKNGINEIRDDFFSLAKKEIHEFAQAHQTEKHLDFANSLFEKLSTKYFWRHWFVASYNGKTKADEQTVGVEGLPWVCSWIDQYDRSVYIVSSDNPENLHAKLETCVTQHHARVNQEDFRTEHVSKDVYDSVKTCIGPHNGLGVVDARYDMQAHDGQNKDPFVSIKYKFEGPRIRYDHEFFVFAMSPELKH